MNLGEVKIRVKRQFGDESGVQITDEDITRWVNDGQKDIVTKNEEVLEASSSTSTVAGQQEYSLPTNIMILRSVSYRASATVSYNPLEGKSFQDFDNLISSWDGPTYGNGWPQVYHVYGGVLKVWPVPDTNVTNGLKIYYSRVPVDVVNDGDQIDLPLPYHNAVVNYCLAQAYELDEDLQTATYKTAQVTDNINTNRAREKDTHRDRYPSISVLPDDMW